MKNKLLSKCFIMLGLLLCFSVLMPFLPGGLATAKAEETGKGKLNVSSVALVKDTTFTLRTYNVSANAKIKFKSGDAEIASVNTEGIITAKNVGNTTITVTIKEGQASTSLTCDVTVGPAAISVKWTKSIVILGLGDTVTLSVITKPSNSPENALFTSLQSDTVSITAGGRASAKTYGYAELRAYIGSTGSDGSQKYDSCGVIVTSSDNTSKLEDFFSQHTELNQVSSDDLNTALDKFFNKEFDQTTSTNLISSLTRYLNDTFQLDKSNPAATDGK